MPTSETPDPTSSHPPPPTPNPPPTQPITSSPPLLIALSGPTSSGKTTLATALRAIFPPPHSLTLHADDFYKPDSQIPITKDGLQDWDCAGSLDMVKLEAVLRDLKTGGSAPEDLLRQGNFEEEDGVHGVRGIAQATIERMKAEVASWAEEEEGEVRKRKRKLVVVDGFLLFGKSVPGSLRELFDVKVLLRARYEDARRRRERRNGYVTLEGFWSDPEGYFERVVWPNYVREHGELVGEGEGGGEGEGWGLGMRVCCSDPGWGLEECLVWVVGVVGREIRGIGKVDRFGLDKDSLPG